MISLIANVFGAGSSCDWTNARTSLSDRVLMENELYLTSLTAESFRNNLKQTIFREQLEKEPMTEEQKELLMKYLRVSLFQGCSIHTVFRTSRAAAWPSCWRTLRATLRSSRTLWPHISWRNRAWKHTIPASSEWSPSPRRSLSQTSSSTLWFRFFLFFHHFQNILGETTGSGHESIKVDRPDRRTASSIDERSRPGRAETPVLYVDFSNLLYFASWNELIDVETWGWASSVDVNHVNERAAANLNAQTARETPLCSWKDIDRRVTLRDRPIFLFPFLLTRSHDY